MYRLYFAAAALAFAASCGSNPIPSEEFLEGEWHLADGYDQQYLIAPGDTLEVNVLTVPDLSREVVVSPNGQVRIPYSGPVTATGRTVDELRDALISALSGELKDPDVEIIALEYASQRIFVGGEVGEPGIFDLPGQIGPLQAIVMAGGFTNEARQKEVLLLRRLAGGEIQSQIIDIRGGLMNAALAEWGPLQRFDVVYVPKTRIAEENLFVQQWVRNALPVEFSFVYDLRNQQQ